MRRPAVVLRVGVTAWLALVPGSASAQDGILQGFTAILDLRASAISTTTTTASGMVSTKTDSLNPRLTLNLSTLLYPQLRLIAGAELEFSESLFTIEGVGRDTTSTKLNPWFQLRSTNPVLSPGIGYFRREEGVSTGGAADLTFVNEDYAAYLGWKPEGLPRSDFQFIRTNTFDEGRAFQDTTKDFGSILSRYSYSDLGVNYRGTFLGTTDHLRRFETQLWSHGARVDYSKSLFANRLLWNTSYNIDYQDVTTVADGEGAEVALPVTPVAGLASSSDFPVSSQLSPNPLLIDANLAASAGIDLGPPGPGEDSQARNIGLDFVNPTAVNRLLIWVDRELPIGVANAFSWEIYSSPDNLVWRREAQLPAAPFGPFENRFELDFPDVTARYIKAVTRPLSPAQPEASRFPDILVTEAQALLRRAAEDVGDSAARTSHIFNTDVRMRLLDTPSLYYEGSYWMTDVNPDGVERDTLSNGVSITHAFNPTVSVFGRYAREQGSERFGYRVANVSSATLTYTPFPTFTGSLLYSGLDERVGDLLNDRRSLLVQTTSQLYRGVDLQLGGGWTFTTRVTGEQLRDDLFNVTTSIVPRQDLTVTFTYGGARTTRSGAFSGDPESLTSRGYLTVAYDPTRTLRLVVGQEVITGLGEGTRTTTDIGANWAPFPDGTLQFIFTYDEALRSLEYGTEQVLRAGVRWNVTSRSYIDFSYQNIRSEYTFQATRTKVLSVDVKLFL